MTLRRSARGEAGDHGKGDERTSAQEREEPQAHKTRMGQARENPTHWFVWRAWDQYVAATSSPSGTVFHPSM